ncbi:unnamed protein product (mitochondrion) [Plasmodiophora brassicae]|uniref:Uncharacterized protein n=1 Tax=Plasmodiophora brassicae TaxID=37360 RepID=A0A3P3YEX7_PLABS|nr:unnamed protein product [Plasmodiophora brassicae]
MADDVLNAIETMSMACRQCAHVTVAGIDQHRVFIATGSWSVAGAPPRLDAVLLEVNVAKNVKRPLRREQDVVVAFNPFDVQGPNRTTRRKTRPDVVLGFHLHVGRAHLRFVGLGTRAGSIATPNSWRISPTGTWAILRSTR